MKSERLLRWVAAALVVAACAQGDPAPATSSRPATSSAGATIAPTAPEPALAARPAGQAEAVTLTVGDVARTYRLYIPPGTAAAGAGSNALVVDLHGLGSDPERHNESTRMRQLADVRGFVVVQPAARGGIAAWNPQPGEPGSDADVAFIRAVVADAATRVPVDPGAVFASGFSNGGGMAHRLACDAADLFAAIGTVAGQYPLVDSCAPDQPVALISFHGTDDLVVPITGVRRVLPDVTQWLEGWVERNGCAPVPLRDQVAPDVVRDRWVSCDGGVEVAFHTVVDGPHAWPGAPGAGFFRPTRSIDASESMWQFFVEHARS